MLKDVFGESEFDIQYQEIMKNFIETLLEMIMN